MVSFQKNRGLFIDVGIVAFVGLVVFILEMFTRPHQRGFFCNDQSIRYPMMPDTVSTLCLAIVSFLAPLIVFVIIEGLRSLYSSTPRDSWNSISSSLLRNLSEVYGVFVFGAGLNQITVDLGKYSIGRLRPHFFDACRPQGVCGPGADPNAYVLNYTCTNGDLNTVEEARLSFPSGHAALSFYAAVFVTLYLQYRLVWRGSRLTRHLIQAVVMFLAWYTALSRVTDYMHHPSDVLAGCTIGTVWSILMIRFVIDLRLDTLATKDELRSLRPVANHVQGPNSV